VIAVLVLAAGWSVYMLLSRISEEGGRSDADAAHTAEQILAEADALRGSRSETGPGWDGVNRLAAPTTEGVLGGFIDPKRADGK